MVVHMYKTAVIYISTTYEQTKKYTSYAHKNYL